MHGFWRSLPGTLVIALIATVALATAATGIQVYRVIHPPREVERGGDLGSMLSHVQDVRFRSSDGIDLVGALLRGRPGGPAIVLGHDLGGSKASLMNLGIALQDAGFTVLAIDFRAHGASGGSWSTLGINEERDLIGAVDYLAGQSEIETRHMGVYGVGMGAHAAVLAAEDRPVLRVLVLDGAYPDIGYSLARRVYRGWGLGVERLGFLPRLVFDLSTRTHSGADRAAAVIPRLAGRDILLVAPAGDTALAGEMKRMYDAIPEQRDADANLITLPATSTEGLYGAEAERYHRRITEFFEQRLARAGRPAE